MGDLKISAHLYDGDKPLVHDGKKVACHATIVSFQAITFPPAYIPIPIAGRPTPIILPNLPDGRYDFIIVAEYSSPQYGLLTSDKNYRRNIGPVGQTKIEIKFPIRVPIKTEEEKRAEKEKREKDKSDRVYDGVSLKPAKLLNRFYGQTEKTTFSIFLALIGIVVGAIFGPAFLLGFAFWAARHILPEPKKLQIAGDWESHWFGSSWAKENRYSTGIAATKSLLKVCMLFSFGYGFFFTDLPARGLLLFAFCLGAYFSLPAEYSTDEPYKFMEGMLKVPVAIFMASVFYSTFNSTELMWITLAFFMIIPIATEKENLARAIGHVGTGISANYEMVDKIIFVILMVIGLISIMGGGGLNLNLGTLAGNIFFPLWVIALIGGLTSPSQVRPYTGILMILLVGIFFTAGPGQQSVGQAFFGQWWPTVHNTMTEVVKPLGEVFSTLQNTFGQTFFLFTNPIGYAHQIMDGTYAPNPVGPTGSFGVEIENLQIPAIYPGIQAMATLNIKNVGPVSAKDVKVRIGLPSDLARVIKLGPDKSGGGIDVSDGIIDSNDISAFKEMEPGSVIPLFFILDASNCTEINKKEGWVKEKYANRNRYIRVNVSVEYDYKVSSWTTITVISEQEWRERTEKGTFAPAKVQSFMSTSPAKLSIGSFDQPLVEGIRPFYIGFNLTSAEGKGSEIIWDRTKVRLDHPDFGPANCLPPPTSTATGANKPPFLWDGNNIRNTAAFCMYARTPSPGAPSRTYYVTANATFGFRKWESKDTLFAFSDVCAGGGMPAPPTCEEPTCDQVQDKVIDHSTNEDVDRILIYAIMRKISGFHQCDGNVYKVTNGKIGLVGLSADIANTLGVDAYNWDQNIRGGTIQIKRLLAEFSQNERIALASYYCGSEKVKNALTALEGQNWGEVIAGNIWSSRIESAIRNECGIDTTGFVNDAYGWKTSGDVLCAYRRT